MWKRKKNIEVKREQQTQKKPIKNLMFNYNYGIFPHDCKDSLNHSKNKQSDSSK